MMAMTRRRSRCRCDPQMPARLNPLVADAARAASEQVV